MILNKKYGLSNEVLFLIYSSLYSKLHYYMKYLERKKERKQDEFFQYTIIQLFTNEVIRIE